MTTTVSTSDTTIVLDPANPIPFRVFDNGDGTSSLAINDPGAGPKPTITLVIDNSATSSQPDFYFEGPAGDTVSVDWGDGTAQTFTLLGYDPSGRAVNEVEATHTYSDGQDTHCVVITGTDLAVLDVLALSFTRASGALFPLDSRWLRGSGAFLGLYLSGTNGIAPLVSGMTSLRVLQLNANQFTALPDLSGLDGLQQLSCSFNALTALPDLSGMTSLQMLYCGNNQLSALPDLSGMTSLQYVYCYVNQLTESAVNAALSQCVAIETAVPGARAIDLSGESNHAPTGQGVTDAATLRAAGWTLYTN